MSESVTFTFKVHKHTDFLKACRGLTFSGAVFGVCAAGAAILAVMEWREDTIEYDARIVESRADVFGRQNGQPLEWDVTFERIPSGQRWTAKAYRTDKHEVGDVVRILENKRGQRRPKQGGLWVIALVFGVLATALLVVGLGGFIPEWAYWPPTTQVFIN